MTIAEKIEEMMDRFGEDVDKSVANNEGRTFTLTDKEMELLLMPIVALTGLHQVMQEEF